MEAFANANGIPRLPIARVTNGFRHIQAHRNGDCDTMNGDGHKSRPAKSRFLIPFSAHDEKTLQANYNTLAKTITNWDLADVAFTLSTRRSLLTYRSFTITSDEEAENGLPEQSPTATKRRSAGAPVLGFVFTGQGAQWPRMGHALMQEYPSFLATIQRLDKYLDELDQGYGRDWSIEEVLSQPSGQSLVHDAKLSQPLVTALQIALVNLLSQWNVTPRAVVGHSSGEIAASYAAGLLSEEEAIIAAYLRGLSVARNTKKGLMVAVGGRLSEIQPLLGESGEITVACHNSAESYTLSGDTDAVLRLKGIFDETKVFCRALSTNDNAYHSHHMKALGPYYEQALESLMPKNTAAKSLKQTSKSRAAQAVFFSSLYGYAAPWSLLGPKYWRQNLESPVLFHQAVTDMVTKLPLDILIEIGPHGALQGPLRQISKALNGGDVKFPEYLSAMVRGSNNVEDVLSLVGSLFNRGYHVDLGRVNAVEGRGGNEYQVGRVVTDLPHYQWQYPKEITLYENRYTREWRLRTHPRHDILGSRVPGGNKTEPTWRNVLTVGNVPWLTDHRVSSIAALHA